MKKQKIPLLIILTAVFAAFTLGLFIGRSQSRGTVEISLAEASSAAKASAALSMSQSLLSGEKEDARETVDTPGLININTATCTELMELPGIGEVLAQRIIDYRTENGSFLSTADLMNVEGIGEKKLEDILDLITTGG